MSSRREFLNQMAGASVAAVSHLATPAKGKAPGPRAGVVQTVRGPIDAGALGFTLPHEHICVASAGLWHVWPELFGGRPAFIAKVVAKLQAAKAEGVDTIVDVTPDDIGRDVRLLEEVSRKSGVHIVACTGHWLVPSLSMAARTVEELTDFFTLEIRRGIAGTDIKPGVIKVATAQDGVTPFIERALRAAARTSKATGVPVTTHTSAPDRTGEKQADIFEAEGLDPSKVCLGHCDDTNDMGYLTGLLKRGYTLGMDHLPFGLEPGEASGPTILTWQQRGDCIKKLVDAGYTNKLFLSTDWYYGASFAPTGFMEAREKTNPDGCLFNTRKTIPYLKQIGVTEQQIRTITVDNPRRFFG